MCTICGTTLQLANAPQAQQERDLINELIAEGKTKEEIKDALVVEYGPEVLAVPSSEGFDLAAWIVPIVGILLALVAIVLAARRWRGERPRRPTPGAAAALSPRRRGPPADRPAPLRPLRPRGRPVGGRPQLPATSRRRAPGTASRPRGRP